MTPSEMYSMPMHKKSMHLDPAKAIAIGHGVARKNETPVQVIIMTCEDEAMARKAYVILLALANGELQ